MDYAGFEFHTKRLAKGEVTALVAVFGNVDRGGDIIAAGAFAEEIVKSESRGWYVPGVFSHDWERPVAKTISMRETDEGLEVDAQFNLETRDGAETFSNIAHGILTQYSFGYTPVGFEMTESGRVLTNIELYEWSPVLWGMNPATRTLSAKRGWPTAHPQAGRLFDQAESALAAIHELGKRVEALKTLRSAGGRTLGHVTRGQLAFLASECRCAADAVSALVDDDAEQQSAINARIERLETEWQRLTNSAND